MSATIAPPVASVSPTAPAAAPMIPVCRYLRADRLTRDNDALACWAVTRVLGILPPVDPWDDAVQEARIALWHMALAFDPAKRIRFATFAVVGVRHALWRWSKVHARYGFTKVGDSPDVRKRRKAKPIKADGRGGGDGSSVPRPLSLDAPATDPTTGEKWATLADQVVARPVKTGQGERTGGNGMGGNENDERDDIEAEVWQESRRLLPPREYAVLRDRLVDGRSYREIADEMGVCHQRVQQLERRALGYLRESMSREEVGST